MSKDNLSKEEVNISTYYNNVMLYRQGTDLSSVFSPAATAGSFPSSISSVNALNQYLLVEVIDGWYCTYNVSTNIVL